MLKVLLFIDWYSPGFKAGGPIQSACNLVRLLSDDVDFFVCTSDRDLGDGKPYDSIQTGKWVDGIANEKVYYTPHSGTTFSLVKQMLKEANPDSVYFNSMFSFRYTLKPLIYLAISGFKGKIILAPRGMLHEGALNIKSRTKWMKKIFFLRIFGLLGMDRKVHFQATNEQELADVKKYFPKAAVSVLSNVPRISEIPSKTRVKVPDSLHLVFLSRLHPTKNTLFILEFLKQFKGAGKIFFDIYGNTDDDRYVEECKRFAQSMPASVVVTFKGPVKSKDVFKTLNSYHAFVLPTHGENFGHAIFESLSCGVPVIISDKTPWHSLEAVSAGWTLPLDSKEKYLSVVEGLLEMNQEEYEKWQSGATSMARSYLESVNLKNEYICLLNGKEN